MSARRRRRRRRRNSVIDVIADGGLAELTVGAGVETVEDVFFLKGCGGGFAGGGGGAAAGVGFHFEVRGGGI